MRVDNNIRHDTLTSEWHILLTVCHSNSTLLSMPGCKLVTNLRHTEVTNTDLGEAIPLLGRTDEHIVDKVHAWCNERACLPFDQQALSFQ